MEINQRIVLVLVLTFIAGVFAGQGIGAQQQYDKIGEFLDDQASIQNNTFEVPGHGMFTVRHVNVSAAPWIELNDTQGGS